jgi:hypothetical protein
MKGVVMTGTVRLELRRALGGPAFWLAILAGSVIAVAQVWVEVLPVFHQRMDNWDPTTAKGAYPLSLYNVWLGESTAPLAMLFFLFCPLLAVIPYGASLAADRASGYVKQLATRVPYRRYLYAKSVAVFVSAALAVVVPLVLNLVLVASFVPALRPQPSTGSMIFDNALWSGLFLTHPLVYTLLYLGLIALWAGAIGLSAIALSYAINNRVLVVIMPFIVLLVAEFALGTVSYALLVFSPLTFIWPAQSANAHLSIVSAEWLIVVGAIVALVTWRGHADEVY